MFRRFGGPLLVCAFAGCLGVSRKSMNEVHPASPLAAADARLAECRAKLEVSPRLYPVWAEAGEAHLERARVTRDPHDVARAEEAFRRSLELQENAVALRGMAALANFRHRFDEALQWAPRAMRAWPEDTSVRAMQIEALLALDRLDETRAVLRAAPPRVDDFHGRCARARILVAEGRTEEGVEEYLAAAGIARDVSADLAAWARIRAAAARLDSGSPEAARAALEQLLIERPNDVDALVHFSEAAAATDLPGEALAALERALTIAPDPTIRAVASPLARRIGDAERATAHAEAASRALERAVDAGEHYTLVPLVHLALDRGDFLGAHEWARLHLERVPSAAARELLAKVEAGPRGTALE